MGTLLDERQRLPAASLEDPDYIPPPPNRTRLDAGREALVAAERKAGVAPAKPKKRDPLDQREEWDEEGVAQDPPPEDMDPRRKGR